MIILGIDPGTATTGYGVIRETKNQKLKTKNYLECLNYGVILTKPSSASAERLKIIHNELNKIIQPSQGCGQ